MAYLNSENIKVFPSIGRDTSIDLNAELTNEKNLTQILRSIYKRDSFVISDRYSNDSLEFVIHGYYFNATFDADALSGEFTGEDKNNIYANIFVAKETEKETPFQQLVNTDTGSGETYNLDTPDTDDVKFKGVLFSDNMVSNADYNVYSLLILTKNDDDNWTVPSKSKLHWKTSEILNGETSTSIDDILTTSTLNATTISTDTADIETLSVTSGTINTLTTSILNATLSLSLSGDVSGSGSTSVVTSGLTISNMTIGDDKVVESKIATGAVTEDKISENAVTTSKIKNESITLEKLVKDDIIRVIDNTLIIFPKD